MNKRFGKYKFVDVPPGALRPACGEGYEDHVIDFNGRIQRCSKGEWIELPTNEIETLDRTILSDEEVAKFRVWWKFQTFADGVRLYFPSPAIASALDDIDKRIRDQIFTQKMYYFVTGDDPNA